MLFTEARRGGLLGRSRRRTLGGIMILQVPQQRGERREDDEAKGNGASEALLLWGAAGSVRAGSNGTGGGRSRCSGSSGSGRDGDRCSGDRRSGDPGARGEAWQD